MFTESQSDLTMTMAQTDQIQTSVLSLATKTLFWSVRTSMIQPVYFDY